jgi:hypothetical protein
MFSAQVPAAGRWRQASAPATTISSTAPRADIDALASQTGEGSAPRRLTGLCRALIAGTVVFAVGGDTAGRHADSPLACHTRRAGGAVAVRRAAYRAIPTRVVGRVHQAARDAVVVRGAPATHHATFWSDVVGATRDRRGAEAEEDHQAQSRPHPTIGSHAVRVTTDQARALGAGRAGTLLGKRRQELAQ